MNTQEIWERGLDLGQADFQLAPKALREEHSAVSQRLKKEADDARQAAPSDLAAALNAFRQQINWAAGPTDVRKKMRAQLCALLKSGSLLAYGFCLPRSASDTPVQVPRDLLSGPFVDWEKSTIKGHGLEFVAVRVVSPSIAAQHKVPNKDDSPQEKRKPGPRSGEQAIIDAYTALLTAGKINADTPPKVICSEVQVYAQEQISSAFPRGRGLSERSIRRALRRFLDSRA